MPVEAGSSRLAGRYRVLEPLGYGGMAAVFLCEDERLGRRVAVKRLHAHSADDVAQRFLREARLGAALNHPNLVSVFDTTTDDEAVLIVMEYVEGETLRDALKRGPLGTERAMTVVKEVASALDHAHAQQVVHRDVKPANILLRHDGITKLVDLGIATAADVTRITQSGIVLGTASYMAPEQLEGRRAGPEADVYALATVAYECLCGCRARRGKTPMEIAHSVATQPPPDLTDDWPDAPRIAAELLRRTMARDPAERPASAGELAKELEAALVGGGRAEDRPRPAAPAPARPARARPPRHERRGGRALAAVAAAVALLTAAAVVALGTLLSGDDGDERSARQDRPGEERPSPNRQSEGEEEAGSPGSATPDAPAAPAQPEPAGRGGAGEGRRLNSQGFRLMQAGRNREAVPVLQRAVAAFPEGSDDIQLAYALYNLGRALRLSGRPREAIPVLERRLQWSNQRDTVERELELARRAAS